MNKLLNFVDQAVNPMKIQVLKNESGMLSEVVIPVEELNELRSSLKNDSEFFKAICPTEVTPFFRIYCLPAKDIGLA